MPANKCAYVITWLSWPEGATSFCSSGTYADVRPPTVTHSMVAGSPEGWKWSAYKRNIYNTILLTKAKGECFLFLFPFPWPSMRRLRSLRVRKRKPTHRCWKSQLSGNWLSSASTEVAVSHTYVIFSCKTWSCSCESVLHLCSGCIRAWYNTSSKKYFHECEDEVLNLVRVIPATQLPTPALKVWSKSRTLMAMPLRLRKRVKNSENVGIESKGSKPSSEIGGSVCGEAHKRIRPNLRASLNAISVVWPFLGFVRCKMNYPVVVQLDNTLIQSVVSTFIHLGGHSETAVSEGASR